MTATKDPGRPSKFEFQRSSESFFFSVSISPAVFIRVSISHTVSIRVSVSRVLSIRVSISHVLSIRVSISRVLSIRVSISRVLSIRVSVPVQPHGRPCVRHFAHMPHFFLTQPCEVRAIARVDPRGIGGSENCVHLPVDILTEGPDSRPGAGGAFSRAPLTRSPPTHFLESSFRNTRPDW